MRVEERVLVPHEAPALRRRASVLAQACHPMRRTVFVPQAHFLTPGRSLDAVRSPSRLSKGLAMRLASCLLAFFMTSVAGLAQAEPQVRTPSAAERMAELDALDAGRQAFICHQTMHSMMVLSLVAAVRTDDETEESLATTQALGYGLLAELFESMRGDAARLAEADRQQLLQPFTQRGRFEQARLACEARGVRLTLALQPTAQQALHGRAVALIKKTLDAMAEELRRAAPPSSVPEAPSPATRTLKGAST